MKLQRAGSIELDLFPNITPFVSKGNTTTFARNMSLPIHGWFRYSAGFSASWVRELIQNEKSNGRYKILDPFAGSGTVLLES